MKRLIFTLVGVSLLDPKKELLGNGFEKRLGEIQNCQNIAAIIENSRILNEHKTQVLETLKSQNLRDNLASFSAEIASLHQLKPQALDNEADKVILIVSETPECAFSGIVNGKFIIHMRRGTSDPEGDAIIFEQSKDVFFCDNVEIKIVEGLQVEKGGEFVSRGIKNLFVFVSKKIKEEGASYDEVIFNITGGYKGTIPYFTLFGMLYQGREIEDKRIKPLVKYLYEKSKDIITLPNLPVAFDLPTWRDYRGVIGAMELLEKEQAEIFLKYVLPPQVSGLFDLQDSKYKINPYGEELKSRYQEEKISLTPFGRGHLLLDKIEDGLLRAYFKGCINQWQHIWIGDKVPEMVAHQRGHAQRVLELAAELLYPILEDKNRKIFQNDKELASLIGAIWLHDLGHSGERFNFEDREYIVKGFPSLIRDFHNLITVTLLEDEEQEIFPAEVEVENKAVCRRNVRNIEAIIENIKAISQYHRKWTPLVPEKISEKKGKHCIKLSKAIRKECHVLAALCRILDACDTQIERTVDGAYIDTRKMTTDREVKMLEKEKENLEKEGISLDIGDGDLKTKIEKAKSRFENLGWIFEEEDETTRAKLNNSSAYINHIVGKIATCPNVEVSSSVKYWLSCLDQIFFKKSSPPHYEKHKGISAVMILYKGKEGGVYKFDIRMVGAKGTTEDRLMSVLEKDINEEYIEVKETLDTFVEFSYSYQCYGQEPQSYQKDICIISKKR